MESPDAYFQHHVLMGAFPTAPFPGNDHTLGPDPEVERYYLDYGKMFTELRGREWILLPQVIEVEGGTALVNAFVRGKRTVLIPVINGTGPSVTLILRHCKLLFGISPVVVRIWHPGEETSSSTFMNIQGDSLTFTIPLRRGCALLF